MRNLAAAVVAAAVIVGVTVLLGPGVWPTLGLIGVAAWVVSAVSNQPKKRTSKPSTGRTGRAPGRRVWGWVRAGRERGVAAWRRRWWQFGPRHPDAPQGCAYCGRRLRPGPDVWFDHLRRRHPREYQRELDDAIPPVDPGPSPAPADRPPLPDPGPAPTPDPEGGPTPSPAPQEDPMPTNPYGTAGRAAVAGTVLDWQTSVEARDTPETFGAWLRAQAHIARHIAGMVPELVEQFHGRGPAGHAGVPDEQIKAFTAAFSEAREAEAIAFEKWAADYGAHVDEAENDLVQRYGREVLKQALRGHQGV